MAIHEVFHICGPWLNPSDDYVRSNTLVIDNNCDLETGQACNWGMHIWVNGGPNQYWYFTNSYVTGRGAPSVGSEQVEQRAVLETWQTFSYPQSDVPDVPCWELPSSNVAHWSNTFAFQPLSAPTNFNQVSVTYQAPAFSSPQGYWCGYATSNESPYTIDLNWTY